MNVCSDHASHAACVSHPGTQQNAFSEVGETESGHQDLQAQNPANTSAIISSYFNTNKHPSQGIT
jgi:hypothetical protein